MNLYIDLEVILWVDCSVLSIQTSLTAPILINVPTAVAFLLRITVLCVASFVRKICVQETERLSNTKKNKHASSSRVTFVNWYHSWWFILIMFFIFPIAGIALLVTSPNKKSVKITVAVIAAIITLVSYFGIGNIIWAISDLWNKPVDTSLSRDEYVATCETVEPNEFYRAPNQYENKFVTLTLTVVDKTVDYDGYYSDRDYTTYYICTDEDGSRFNILIRNCIQDGASNFVSGDVITVYGEGAGEQTIYDINYDPYTAPCINAAYATIE